MNDIEYAECDICDGLCIRRYALIPLPPRGNRESDMVDAILCDSCREGLADTDLRPDYRHREIVADTSQNTED